MNILHIANGYLRSDVNMYDFLFEKLKKVGTSQCAYVPINKEKRMASKNAGNMIETIVSPCFSKIDRCLFFPKQRKMLADVEKKHLLQGIDILHAHTVFSGGYLAWRVKKKYGIPYIVAVRNTDVNLFFKKLFFMRGIGRKIMENAEKVIFLSPAYRDNVLNTYFTAEKRETIHCKSEVIPNGISPLFFANPGQPKELSEDVIRLICVGELCTNKNLEETVDAAKILMKKGRKIEILAVGKILEEKYRTLIDENSFLEYHEKCPQEQVIEYLRRSDIFVMPSHHETFGLVYAEAMSQGLPVLYTAGQGFDRQFLDGTVGYAVNDHDTMDLVEKIEYTIEHYEELSNKCIDLVKHFRWDDIAESYATIYHSITD